MRTTEVREDDARGASANAGGVDIKLDVVLVRVSDVDRAKQFDVVSDIEAARSGLVARGVEVSEVLHDGTGGGGFTQPMGPVG